MLRNIIHNRNNNPKYTLEEDGESTHDLSETDATSAVELTRDSDDAGGYRKYLYGYGFGLLGMLTATIGLASAQILDKSVPHSELNGFRFVSQFAIITPFVAGLRKCDIRVEKKDIVWVLLASVVTTVISYTHYGSAYYLPLGVATGLTRSICLICNCIISCGSRRAVIWSEAIAAVLCISGIMMVTQPAFIFHVSEQTIITSVSLNISCRVPEVTLNMTTYQLHNITTMDVASWDESWTGYILCVVTGLGGAIYTQLIGRKLATFDIFVYNFWSCLFAFSTSFCIMAATETPYLPSDPFCIAILMLHAILGGSYALFTYCAFQLLDPVVSSLILTLQIVLSFILQYTLLSGIYPGHANTLEIMGAVLVFVGNAFASLYQFIQLARTTDKK